MKIAKFILLCVFLVWSEDRLNAAPVTIGSVEVRASLVKPLVLTGLQGMNLGTITIAAPGTWSGATVRISQSGALTCSSNLICSGFSQPAQYRISGTNKQTVSITAPAVVLTNLSDGSKKLVLSLDAPPSVRLPNSGNPGEQFSVGGTLILNSATADGLYSGTLSVTVDYN